MCENNVNSQDWPAIKWPPHNNTMCGICGRWGDPKQIGQLRSQNAVLERLLNEALEWLPWDTGDLLRARIRAQLRLPIPAIAQPDEGAE